MQTIHDSDLSDLRWVVSIKWDIATCFIVQTDVAPSELSQAVASAQKMIVQSKRLRTPALQITRMDEAGYCQTRYMERKGKRRHPMDREWQRILATSNRQKKLEDQRKAKRCHSEVIQERIKAYVEERKREDGLL